MQLMCLNGCGQASNPNHACLGLGGMHKHFKRHRRMGLGVRIGESPCREIGLENDCHDP